MPTAFGFYGGFHSVEAELEEAAQESFPGDLDQAPDLDPTDPEPIPQGDFEGLFGRLDFLLFPLQERLGLRGSGRTQRPACRATTYQPSAPRPNV